MSLPVVFSRRLKGPRAPHPSSPTGPIRIDPLVKALVYFSVPLLEKSQ